MASGPRAPGPPGSMPEDLASQTTMPQVRMPSGAPTMWPAPPPPPPCHAPPGALPPGALPRTMPGAEGSRAFPASQEVLAAVGQRVSLMLAAATRASESQVSAELRRLETGFASLSAKVGKVEALLSRHEPRRNQKDALIRAVFEVEQRLDQEIKTVKRELHQTILAHNHNAELMADHKTAIDTICVDIEERGPPLQVEPDSQLGAQLERLQQTLEQGRARDQDVDALLRRGEVLLQRLGALGLLPPLPLPYMGVPLPAPYGPVPGYHPHFSHLSHLVL